MREATARSFVQALFATGLLLAGPGLAQEGGAGATRLLVTRVRVPPAKVGAWLELRRNEVVPALKKAGLKSYATYDQSILRRLPELSF